VTVAEHREVVGTSRVGDESSSGALSAQWTGARGQSPASAGRTNLQGRRATTVGQIRRSLGAFTIAAVMATGMVMMPTSVYAKNNKNNGDLGLFCQTLSNAIEYINNSSLDPAIKAAFVEPLQNAFDQYCTGVSY
jgi:hypothetical protein